MKGDIDPLNLYASRSKAMTLWCRVLHVTPCQLQNGIESFHVLKTPIGSLVMDSLNFSKANMSVSFVGAQALGTGRSSNNVSRSKFKEEGRMI